MCCCRSEAFARRLAFHTNTDFAFKHFLPNPAVYPDVSEELFRLLEIFASRKGSSNSLEAAEATNQFRKHIIPVLIHDVDGQNWAVWLKLFKVLLQNADDMTTFIANDGLTTVTEAFGMLQQMYHEATACNVVSEVFEVLTAVDRLLKMVRLLEQGKTQEAQGALEKWAKRMQLAHWLLNFLNPSTLDKLRDICLEILLHLVHLFPSDCIDTLLPVLEHTHRTVKQSGYKVISGAFFPRKHRSRSTVSSHLGPRRMCELHMHLHSSLLEVEKGIDRDYDTALFNYFAPYHQFAFELIRVALSRCTEVQETAVSLSALLAVEGAPIHLKFAAEFWSQVMVSNDKKLLPAFELFRQLPTTRDYCDAVLFFYRKSLAETSIYSLLSVVFPKAYVKLLPVTRWQKFAETLIALIVAEKCTIEGQQKSYSQMTLIQQLIGNLCALHIVLSGHGINIHECQPDVISTLVNSLSFFSNIYSQVEVKLKELRGCPVEDGRTNIESTINDSSDSEAVLDHASEKHSEEQNQNHQEVDASQLLSSAKKVRLAVETDSDEYRKDIEADIGEQTVQRQDNLQASGQVGGDPATCIDMSWLESLDDQKRLLSLTSSLVTIAKAIIKQVQQ
jgi:ubiquitin carboxyl-terminal hydrolase 34